MRMMSTRWQDRATGARRFLIPIPVVSGARVILKDEDVDRIAHRVERFVSGGENECECIQHQSRLPVQ